MGAVLKVWQFALITVLFAYWGIYHNLNDVLIKQFQKAFDLKNVQAGFVQSAFYFGYFFAAMPAALLAQKYNYKATIMCGLALASIGSFCFYPSSRGGGSFPGFLICLYCIACGVAFLETAANPWVVILGNTRRKGFGTQALNFTQSWNTLGAVLGIIIGKYAILGHELSAAEIAALPPTGLADYRRGEASMVGIPYVVMGIAVVALLGLYLLTPFPSESGGALLTFKQVRMSLFRLCRRPNFPVWVFAQFCYVGGQVCTWSFIVGYVQYNRRGASEQRAADFIIYSLVTYSVGRFTAAALLTYVDALKLLFVYASMCCVLSILTASVGGTFGIVTLCATSFFMSMIFPTIFGLAISSVEDEVDAKIGASLLVMSICGAALFTPIMGAIGDASSITHAYYVPAAVFSCVAASAAFQGLRPTAPGAGKDETKPLI